MPALGLTGVFFAESSVEKWELVRKSGFQNIEVCYRDSGDPDQIIKRGDGIYRQAVEAGLKPASAHLPFLEYWDVSSANVAQRRVAIEAQMRLIDHIASLSIPLAVLHPSFEPIDPAERKARLALSAEAIAQLGPFAKERGIVLAVENLPRTCLGNVIEEMLVLTDHGQSAKICMDVNHLLTQTHEAYIAALGPHIVHAHLSDYDRVDEKHWLPGNGVIDWHKVISLLTNSGYQGDFLIEIREYTAVPGSIITPQEVGERVRSLLF